MQTLANLVKGTVREGGVREVGADPKSVCSITKRVSAICLLLKKQLPPKSQIPCFRGFVFWCQSIFILITILKHEEKEEGYAEK